jgi:signal transduction histidine kinase/CheY-like chemotaxis protein
MEKTNFVLLLMLTRRLMKKNSTPRGKKYTAGKNEKKLSLVLSAKIPQTGVLENPAEWGWIVSCYAPILNSSGEAVGILSCGFDAQNIYAAIRRTTISKIIVSVIFIMTGIIMYLLLLRGILRQYRQFQELHSKAQTASEAKNNFLVKTSNGIRAPVNAIMSMSDLLLRRDIPSDAHQDALNIKHAGSNLLAIINNIVDFSKIESGQIEIIKTNYQLSSLLNDVINIIRVQASEKPVRFTVNAGSKLPNYLIGDASRIKQVLLILLSNAVKYTDAGHISLTVAGEHTSDKKFIKLHFAVSDTGAGIKQKDIKKLFTEFMQIDIEKSQSVEGTGLGLAIGKNLCRLMDGDITVDSTYGKGSVFTAVIRQEIADMRPVAYVPDAGTKATLLFENRAINLQSVTASLQNLGVPVTPCSNPEMFFRELRKGAYAFAFNPSPLMPQTLGVIEEQKLPTVPVLLADLGTTAEPLTASLLMPAYALPIANVLNGIVETQNSKKPIARFSVPDARVLVVDDISANLIITKGLLSMYQAAVDAASNGPDAIALAKETAYDIIFVAHMMHGMDGIETAYVIRSLYSGNQLLPIIALTANALSGMKEMFLQNGFNDYLSKPVEIAKLNEIMEKWIPAEKRITR